MCYCSLLLALDALATTWVSIIVLVVVISLLTAGGVQVSLFFFIVAESDGLFSTHVNISWLLARQSLLDRGNCILWHLFGEHNLEHDVEVAEVVWLLVEGKTLVLNGFDVVWLDDFTWRVFDSYRGAVEVFKHEVDTSQGLVQSDFFLHQQVGTFALEDFVGLFLHDDDNVTWLGAWVLVSLAVEVVSLSVWCSLVNISINDLLLLLDLLAQAVLASVLLVDNFALTSAVITRLSRLGVVAWPELLHLGDHTSALARTASLNSAVFATLTITLCTNTLTVDCNFGFLSVVHVFKSDLEWVLEWLHLLWPGVASWTAATKHLAENVVHSAAATAAFFQAFLTILVVDVALLCVSENFVSFLQLLELLLVTTTVWMVFQSEFSECFLDLVGTGSLFDSEDLVETFVVG